MKSTKETVAAILRGDVRTAARLMRDLDDGIPQAREILKQIYPYSGLAHIIGITGSPGVGKSTLTDRLIQHLRVEGKTVGVVAVDPTSPFTGGALLGDRIRMQRHAVDEGVFIRSLATRGHFGGLTASARAVVNVMDAMGKDFVLVETVGAGQDEVEIAGAAYTTIVVTVPGLGDEVQASKAGILEIADILIVNKADRDGAARAYQDLLNMLEMQTFREDSSWRPRVLMVQANEDQGVVELMEVIREHQEYLYRDQGKALNQARYKHLRETFLELLKIGVFERLVEELTTNGRLEATLQKILEKRVDPYSASETLVKETMGPRPGK